jgi:acetamidase/formamidase
MSTPHVLNSAPGTVHWGYFDAALAPVLEIDPGDIVVVNSVSGSSEETPDDAAFTVRPALRAIHAAIGRELGPHILTGPIAVRGAEPGDALRIEILDVALADDWGFNVIRRGKGALPEDFAFDSTIHLSIDRQTGVIRAPWGMEIPARPFFGVMGTAPAPDAGRLTSVIPGAFGGNLDNTELTTGAILYLPVAVEGGRLSVGDGHAAQGDGEVCLTAVETGLTGTLRIGLVKAANLAGPFAETPAHLIAMAFDEDLDEALRGALRNLIAMVSARTGLSAENAYRLCSLAADMRVTQVVNVKKGVHAMLPRRYLIPAARAGNRGVWNQS